MRRPGKAISPRRITLRVYARYETRKVHARVHVVGETHITQDGKVELALYQQRSRKIVGRKTIRSIGSGRMKEVSFNTRNIPSGCCAFRATFIDRYGTRFDTAVLHDKLPGRIPWLGSAEGVRRNVPKPWTPLGLSRTATGLTIRCSGRRHEFDPRSFARSIRSAGKPMLAGPARLLATVNGKEARWSKGTLKTIAEHPDQVIFTQQVRSTSGLVVNARTEMDFDGMMRVDFGLSSSKEIRLDSLAIEIPIPAERAKYLYHFPGKWGTAYNAGALPKRGVTMGFRPYVWLGDEERGLAWFTESDRNWFNTNPKEVTEIRREGDTVLLRVHLVSIPLRLRPGTAAGSEFTGIGEVEVAPSPSGEIANRLRYTFGMQATPVKPVDKDAWDHRIVCIGQGTPGFRPRLNVSNALLDRLVRRGVRAVVIFEYWADAESHTKTPHAAALKKIVQACHERGLKVLLYFGFLISDIAPEWRDFGKDCVALPKGGYPVYHYLPQPEQSAWRVCLNSPWQDFMADGIAEAMTEFDADGVYLDGTEYPFACCNTEHGCGTLKPDGSIALTYPIFGVRSAMRRIHDAVRSRKADGLVNVHNSTCMTMPTLGWATSYWDGEQFQNLTKGSDMKDLLPLDAFRAEFMGRQWGVPAEFLCYGNALTYRQSWAITLLHDVPVRPAASDDVSVSVTDLGLASAIWKAMDRFGRKEAEWLPYWGNSDYVAVSPRDAYVSLYRHPNNGVLAVVSNLTSKRAAVNVKLNLRRLGLSGASLSVRDALRHRSVATLNGTVKCSLPGLGWKLLWIRRSGRQK